ncbi:MAG: hypothetical protein FKY71_15455 [Spiribacter salinus]|uniref:Uncharacterized protein n=1 Tax=Spiribacter salinus TaxID=1335746 RepID=A0A540VMY7_9GAMM|nr:MAG: hypothetical protein FKY71_15455 [Spiribacter salinus]
MGKQALDRAEVPMREATKALQITPNDVSGDSERGPPEDDMAPAAHEPVVCCRAPQERAFQDEREGHDECGRLFGEEADCSRAGEG